MAAGPNYLENESDHLMLASNLFRMSKTNIELGSECVFDYQTFRLFTIQVPNPMIDRPNTIDAQSCE